MPDQRSQVSWVSTLVVFALAFGFLLTFADQNGFEGDDLNSVLPMLHLREALNGDLLIYRPDWQPLSYQLGALVYKLTGLVSSIFLLAPLFVAAGIALQYQIVRKFSFSATLFIPLLFLFPEMLYTGLYYNSSALGFPFVCGAVLLAFTKTSQISAIFIGALLAIAVLMRIDFVLIAPFVVVIRAYRRRSFLDFVLAGLGAMVIFGLALLTQILDPKGVVEVYSLARQEIIDRADAPGWDRTTKVFVASVIFSPLGWGTLLIGCIWTLLNPKHWVLVLICLICLAPMIYAAQNILTAKYMVPAYAVFPMGVAILWGDITTRWSKRARHTISGIWIAGTAFFFVAAADPQNEAPFIDIGMRESRVVGTHDGPRSWGAYMWHIAGVKAVWGNKVESADALFETLSSPRPRSVVFVGLQGSFSPGALVWRHLQLELVKQGYRGNLITKEALVFNLPSGTIIMKTPEAFLPPEYADACFIDLLDDPSEPEVSARVLACK